VEYTEEKDKLYIHFQVINTKSILKSHWKEKMVLPYFVGMSWGAVI